MDQDEFKTKFPESYNVHNNLDHFENNPLVNWSSSFLN